MNMTLLAGFCTIYGIVGGLEWHISWYLIFLPENRKNDWFPARKNQENQEIYCY